MSLDDIIYDRSHHPITRIVALTLKDHPFMTLKDFFLTLSDHDLFMLSDMVEAGYVQGSLWYIRQLLVQMEILSRAEMAEATTEERVIENGRYYAVLISAAALERRGFCEVIWENVSFGPEFDGKTVIRQKSA